MTGASDLMTAVAATAAELFAANSKRSDDLEAALDALLVHVTPDVLAVKPPSSPVEYRRIYESSTCVIGVFAIRRGESMPIHDHPDMTVITKLVQGDLHVKTFSLLGEDKGPLRRARVVTDSIYSASKSSSLFTSSALPSPTASATADFLSTKHSQKDAIFKIRPQDGPNLHSFTAVSDYAVIIDIMGPPYLPGERDITYYSELPIPAVHHSCSCKTPSLIDETTAKQDETDRREFFSNPAERLTMASYKRNFDDVFSEVGYESSAQKLKYNRDHSQDIFSSEEETIHFPVVALQVETPQLCDCNTPPLMDEHDTIVLKVDAGVEVDCAEVDYEGLAVSDFTSMFARSEHQVEDVLNFALMVERTQINS
ncbi:hypothetical protein HDU78_008388 [Chytriomyces hyalinus]|nr:hypothetical protein HDU78_008388 [Chytriomyces hyalinus]